MSLVDVILSRPEIVLSLVFVGIVLLAAVGLAVGPGIDRGMKKRAAERKAAREAKRALAAQKKAQAQRKRNGKSGTKGSSAKSSKAKQGAKPRRPAPEEDSDTVEAIGEADEEDFSEAEDIDADIEIAPYEAEDTPIAANKVSAPVSDGAVAKVDSVLPPPPEPSGDAAKAAEDIASDMQSILDSVFVNEEANARFEVLLRDLEVLDIDELLALTHEVAGELSARSNKQAK